MSARAGIGRPVAGFAAAAARVPGLVTRAFDPANDFQGLATLIETVNIHDGVEWLPTAEALRHDWELLEGLDLRRDVLVALVAGEIVGYVEHSWRVRGERVFHHLHPAVRPDHRHRGIGRALLGWVEHRVRGGLAAGELGATIAKPHVLAGWADLEVPDVEAFAAAAGYLVEGYGVLMTRALADPIPDLPLPEGLEIRPVQPEDHRPIWDADCEAFQDHRDPAARTESDFLSWFSQPDLDTSLWLAAWDGDEVAASVMNFVFQRENERLGLSRGWLEHVSVRKPWRRRGLASALIARSMTLLRDAGLEEAALLADAENLTGAVRIYEALGFRRVRTGAAYRKPVEVPPGPGAVLETQPRPT